MGLVKTVALEEPDETQAAAALRDHGARFAFVYGSRVDGGEEPGSDLDIAAWSMSADFVGYFSG